MDMNNLPIKAKALYQAWLAAGIEVAEVIDEYGYVPDMNEVSDVEDVTNQDTMLEFVSMIPDQEVETIIEELDSIGINGGAVTVQEFLEDEVDLEIDEDVDEWVEDEPKDDNKLNIIYNAEELSGDFADEVNAVLDDEGVSVVTELSIEAFENLFDEAQDVQENFNIVLNKEENAIFQLYTKLGAGDALDLLEILNDNIEDGIGSDLNILSDNEDTDNYDIVKASIRKLTDTDAVVAEVSDIEWGGGAVNLQEFLEEDVDLEIDDDRIKIELGSIDIDQFSKIADAFFGTTDYSIVQEDEVIINELEGEILGNNAEQVLEYMTNTILTNLKDKISASTEINYTNVGKDYSEEFKKYLCDSEEGAKNTLLGFELSYGEFQGDEYVLGAYSEELEIGFTSDRFVENGLACNDIVEESNVVTSALWEAYDTHGKRSLGKFKTVEEAVDMADEYAFETGISFELIDIAAVSVIEEAVNAEAKLAVINDATKVNRRFRRMVEEAKIDRKDLNSFVEEAKQIVDGNSEAVSTSAVDILQNMVEATEFMNNIVSIFENAEDFETLKKEVFNNEDESYESYEGFETAMNAYVGLFGCSIEC